MKHALFGLGAAGLASSILAFEAPYYPVVAAAALLVLFLAWLSLTIREARSRRTE